MCIAPSCNTVKDSSDVECGVNISQVTHIKFDTNIGWSGAQKMVNDVFEEIRSQNTLLSYITFNCELFWLRGDVLTKSVRMTDLSFSRDTNKINYDVSI